MSMTGRLAVERSDRNSPRWWRVVLAAVGVYVALLGGLYLLLLPAWLRTIAPWPLLDALLVALAAFAASHDLVVARRSRRLRRSEVIGSAVTAVLVAAWVVGLMCLPLFPETQAVLLRVVIVVPALPVIALAWLGAVLRRT